MVLKSAKIIVDENEIKITIGDGTVVYSTDINSFEENSGLTIHNIELASLDNFYYINLKEIGKNFICGTVIENLALGIQQKYSNSLIIINFDEVEDVSEKFLKSYTKFLLETSNKILTINMSPSISNAFGAFIETNIQKEIETEEEE